MKRFIESKGFKIDLTILYQDNMNTIKVAENGKHSSGKRTTCFDIKYFYITDLINQKGGKYYILFKQWHVSWLSHKALNWRKVWNYKEKDHEHA